MKIPFLGKRKPQSANIGSESAEGEVTAVVDERPKTSVDFLNDYPSKYNSELRFEEGPVRRALDSLVDELRRKDSVRIDIADVYQQSGKEPVVDGSRKVKEAFRMLVGYKHNVVVNRTEDLEEKSSIPSIKTRMKGSVNLTIYPTNFNDLFIATTEISRYDPSELDDKGNLQIRRNGATYVLKMPEERVQDFKRFSPDNRIVFSRIDSRFAETMSRAVQDNK